MNRFNYTLRVIFHLFNLLLIFIYLYPGSILGYFLYGSFNRQPHITNDYFYISSNHFYAFGLISFLGFCAYFNSIKINFWIKYLFLLSILLELFHIIIPQRSFQISDLIGNILGFSIMFTLYKLLKYI